MAFSFLGDPIYWGVLLLVVLGVGVIGVLPGIGGPMVLAIVLPFVIFGIGAPVIGLTIVVGIASRGNTLDAIPAVLLGFPSATTQVTYFEGNQLATKGQGAYTLGAIYAVSAIGGLVGAAGLLITLPVVRSLLLGFSYPEIAAMAIFGVTMVSTLSQGAMLKGLIAGILGVLLGMVGTTLISPSARYSMGLTYLFDGIPLIPIVLGLFAMPEMVDFIMRDQPVGGTTGKVNTGEVLRGARYGLTRWPMAIRQGFFGMFFGAVPGVGGAVVDWLCYSLGITLSKNKTGFGKGSLEGVMFAEAANNATAGGQAIPTLVFGVPGGLTWAIVLAAMVGYGVAPGLGMVSPDQNLHITVSIVVTLALGNVFMTLLGLAATGHVAKLTLVPYSLLAAVLVPLLFIAGYQSSQSWGDIVVVLVFGGLGLVMKWHGWPRPPLMIGFILGPIIESNLWPALQIFGLSMIGRPVTIALIAFSVGALFVMHRAMKTKPSGAISKSAPQDGPRTPAERESAAGDPDGRKGIVEQRRRLPWIRNMLTAEFLISFLLLVLAIYAFVEAQGFRTPPARFMPTWVSAVLIMLLLIQLSRQVLGFHRQGQIMDIGMRSGTDLTALKQLATTMGWIGGYIVAVGLVGMAEASVGFALVFGLLKLRWPWPSRLWGLMPAILIALLVYGVFGQAFYLQWPEPYINIWLPFE